MRDSIVVIGGNHQNTLGVIEALGEKGINPIVIIMGQVSTSFVLCSRYVKKGFVLDHEDDIVNTIICICAQTDGVVSSIACSDDAAVLLDNNHNKWPNNFTYPSTKQKGSLFEWTSKERMNEIAQSIGFRVPKSEVINSKIIPNGLNYPLVTKPFTSVHNGKNGFALCKSSDDLVEYIEKRDKDEPFLVQQYIEKDFEFQLIGCSLNHGEIILIPGRTNITTTTGFNNLVFLSYDRYEPEFEETVDLTKSFIQYTGYSGLFSVEFIRGRDGINYFLEMNFRNDGNGIAVTASGVNLPYIWYLWQTQGNWREEIDNTPERTIFMMPELSFFTAMLNGEVGFVEWLKDLKKSNCFLTYFRNDPEPFKRLIRDSRLIRAVFSGLSKRLGIYGLIKKAL